MTSATYIKFPTKGMLLRLGARTFSPARFNVPAEEFFALQQNRSQMVTVEARSTQPATLVRGFEKLVALDLCRTGRAHLLDGEASQAPSTGGQPGDKRPTFQDRTVHCFPLSLRSGSSFLVLWHVVASKREMTAGTSDESQDEDDEEEDMEDDYTPIPTADIVRPLLERALRSSDAATGAPCDLVESDQWFEGGVMQRICAASVFGCRVVHQHVWDVANEAQSANLTANGPLEFCFDFIRCDDGPEKLLFVQDAARPPLAELEEEDFLRRYGLRRRLCFQHCARRRAEPSNWFAEVY